MCFIAVIVISLVDLLRKSEEGHDRVVKALHWMQVGEMRVCLWTL